MLPPLSEIKIKFVLASGPGGQNLNKVATCVQLQFQVAASPSLTEEVKQRLIKLAGRRMTKDGWLTIEAKRFRSQDKNRADALERLEKLIKAALSPPPPPRVASRPSAGAVEKRLRDKKLTARKKKARQFTRDD